jgi:DNA polymerase-3 subunit alpha
MNFSEYKQYDTPFPVGLRLPSIIIEDKYLKEFNVSKNISNFDFLKLLCRKGIKDFGLDKVDNKKQYYDRTLFELNTLQELSFTDYILLNWDIINFCKESKIPTGAGRGSAAGSLVLFLLGVTKIDPIKYELYFERFISKTRARKFVVDGIEYLDGSLAPDIDNDIAQTDRQKVLDYISEKYKGKTSKILTLNSLSSKLCMKECGKIVAELSETQVNEISDTIPKKFGKVAKLNAAYEESESFKKYADQHIKVYEIAKKLEGLIKNTGVHPSGICISYYELEDIMPLQKTNDGFLVSGYDMNDVASMSVKFDILGLRTLSVVDNVCEQVGINMNDIDVHDPSIYAALAILEQPQGLFQLEADTNFKVSQLVSPRNLEQLSAVVAIARPGALDFKDMYAEYARTGEFQSIHPFFDKILGETGGVCLFQEQTMKLFSEVGFSLEDAEIVRKVMGKKQVEKIEEWESKIRLKMIEKGLSEEIGELLIKIMADSANYSFNKCIFEEELVELSNGKKIKLNEVLIGDTIKCFNFPQKEQEYKQVKDVMTNKVEIFEIELNSGHKVRASAKHRFICEDGIKRTFREIQELGIGIVVSH